MRKDLQIDAAATASWGEPRRRSTAENEAPAPPLPIVGAAMDVQGFQYQRPIPGGDTGLVRLAVDAAALAHASGATGRFSDVRVLDDTGRQVPYLVERAPEPLSLDVRIEPRSQAPEGLEPAHGARSFYVVHLPYSRLPSARLVLSTSARVFARRVAAVVERAPDARRRNRWAETLAGVSWSHADDATPAPAATLPLPPLSGRSC